ncbi:hypothetical protein [Actinoplanes sp. NPDC051411]|uniref:hypothetical protein n=1 Tax=Actinoplanes sp. NPDC051411 TaxID=3155522 RepID=UPI00343E8936
MASKIYFSDYFQVSEDVLDAYGALNICLVSDLPAFVDPFLIFQSEKAEYQELHDSMIRYLAFLRDHTEIARRNKGLRKEWFIFREVKQNWLGFTFMGNGGNGPGEKFANSLMDNLSIFVSSEKDAIHLEQIRLVDDGVGRDGVSDFATNIIKKYLLEYTQEFGRRHISQDKLKIFRVDRVEFDYETRVWRPGLYELPYFEPRDDYALLTPTDILLLDETFINRKDLTRKFDVIVRACEDETLRGKINEYFKQKLMEARGEYPRYEAISATLLRFPVLHDLYLQMKEREAEEALTRNADDVDFLRTLFVSQVRKAIDQLERDTDFYAHSPDSYVEARKRVLAFKRYIEDQDGYKLLNRKGKTFSREEDVQLFFGLVWYGTTFDVNREPNNGRGPVDFKVSFGRTSKALVELKLASNSHLRQNLLNQVSIYEKANETQKSIKVILFYTEEQQAKVHTILAELKMRDDPSVILIDARRDNKPSASKA